MEIDRKAVLEFARRNLQYDTDNPFEATIRAVETWLKKNNIKLVKEQGQPTQNGEALNRAD